MAAEDYLLNWLDERFVTIGKDEDGSILAWLRLLQLIYDPTIESDGESVETNETQNVNNLIDVDIFDDTEPNTFDETIFTSLKCYQFLIKHVEKSKLDTKPEFLSKYDTLLNL